MSTRRVDYTAGTITLTSGSTAFTGTGVVWDSADLEGGDQIFLPEKGLVLTVESIDSNTTGTLTDPCPAEAAGAGQVYRLRYQPDGSRLSGQTQNLIDMLGSGAFFQYDASGPLSERSQYDDQPQGFSFLDTTTDPMGLYIKGSDTSGDWDGPVAYATGATGDPGTAATVAVGGTTTLASGEDAIVTNSGTSTDAVLEFGIPKGDTGNTGPSGTITSATAVGLASGASPTVTLGGTPEARTMEFGIPKGDVGAAGINGWTPVFAVVADGARYVQQVVDWTGGTGAKPSTGQYVGPTGFVALIGNAVNIRGASGAGTGDVVGPASSLGNEIAVFDGTTGKTIKDSGVLISDLAISSDIYDFYSTLALEQAEDRASGPVFGGPSGNGVFDGFNVLTYVDTANAVDLDTTTVGELRVSDVKYSLADGFVYTLRQAGYINYCHRMWISAAELERNGSRFRITFTGPATGNPAVVTSMYVGQRAATGEVYDMDGGQVPVTVGGNGAFSLPIGADLMTDWIDLAIDDTKDLIVSFFTSSGDMVVQLRSDQGGPPRNPNYEWWSKVGTDESGVSDVTGYAMSPSYDIASIKKIEVEDENTVGNLTVTSSVMALAAQPDWARLYALVDLNTAAMGTDVQFAVARGVGYVNATMGLLYTRPDGVGVYGSGNIDLSAQAAGTTGQWRIKTVNEAQPRILAVGVMFGAN